jgi:hypothetical protein
MYIGDVNVYELKGHSNDKDDNNEDKVQNKSGSIDPYLLYVYKCVYMDIYSHIFLYKHLS